MSAPAPAPALECEPIGVVRTPFETPADAPRQGLETDLEGEIVLAPEYERALEGLAAKKTVEVVWHADRVERSALRVRDGERGVFSTRAPQRPNPICVTTCDVLAVEPPRVTVAGVDMVDDTPVLDLKPSLE
ncbi:tRNA (N6-threonylcarbamoyladenosine(37)-N6)-methyltransferase TrmO [Halopiger aswanensis]|uniref:tRNA-Thr(GGU) m(6)t(6)A37 methyltransferase TsaA n=1 Tax=Halopiger aswanensis TaxID=148449 RepID=A0A3R7GYG6_9EURY|nr:tRNA (N6-threonylcarbamoyladenosine(37)-N6)-methyltransferase TrmO [Halopiger aswanensis]RKD97960.1 tRNA-Thr(GGU) m(6)t(6)A37 methyltransferase TsaA [Halopiger aswanensis]